MFPTWIVSDEYSDPRRRARDHVKHQSPNFQQAGPRAEYPPGLAAAAVEGNKEIVGVGEEFFVDVGTREFHQGVG